MPNPITTAGRGRDFNPGQNWPPNKYHTHAQPVRLAKKVKANSAPNKPPMLVFVTAPAASRCVATCPKLNPAQVEKRVTRLIMTAKVPRPSGPSAREVIASTTIEKINENSFTEPVVNMWVTDDDASDEACNKRVLLMLTC